MDAKPQILEQIEEILSGIDVCEIDNDSGWWETPEGAEFGANRLRAIRALFGVVDAETKDSPPQPNARTK